jgi:7-cyano-7-deazaguanine synthase
MLLVGGIVTRVRGAALVFAALSFAVARACAAVDEAMRLGTYAWVKLLRPFITMTKGEIAAAGVKLGVNFARTWSCYKGGEIHCGKCGTCVERREAFALAGVRDPTVYASNEALPEKPKNEHA